VCQARRTSCSCVAQQTHGRAGGGNHPESERNCEVLLMEPGLYRSGMSRRMYQRAQSDILAEAGDIGLSHESMIVECWQQASRKHCPI
jgi:hypothetical protein